MPGRRIAPAFTRRNIKRFTGIGTPLGEILDYAAIRDVNFEKYDFNIKALDTTNIWTVGAGTTATTWALRAEVGGWLRGITGTTAATSGLQLSIPQKYWDGDHKAGMAALIRTSTTAELQLEVGFVNALPAVNTTILNNTTTPTYNTATTAALYLYKQTGTAAAIQGLYVAGTSMTSAAYNIASPAPSATTPFFIAIQTLGDNNNVALFIGDSVRPVLQTTVAVNYEGGDGIIPVVSVKSLTDANSQNVDVDFIATWSERLG